MDPLSITALTIIAAGFAALIFVGGYETASRHLTARYQAQADRRIQGVLDSVNSRRPKSAKNRRKAQRKGVRA